MGSLAAAGAFALIAGTAQSETLRASHQWNTNDVRHEMVEIIKTGVEKAGVGLNVRIYPSASLYKPKEQYAPLTTGQLDISAFPPAYAADRHPQIDATLMPGLSRTTTTPSA